MLVTPGTADRSDITHVPISDLGLYLMPVSERVVVRTRCEVKLDLEKPMASLKAYE
jgi:hypothetical protein